MEEQIVHDPGVTLAKSIQLMWQGEDDVEVGDSEKFFFPCGEPALASFVPDTSGSAGFGRNYKRWPDDRIANIDRRGRRALRYGSA